jgi:hypothetical protein
MAEVFEVGLYTFGDLTRHPQSGKAIGAQQRLAEILAAAKLADASSLDVLQSANITGWIWPSLRQPSY